jgi:hypothetical protein
VALTLNMAFSQRCADGDDPGASLRLPQATVSKAFGHEDLEPIRNSPPRPLPRPTLPEGGCYLLLSLREGRPLRAGEGLVFGEAFNERITAQRNKKPADWELRSPIDRQSGVSNIS